MRKAYLHFLFLLMQLSLQAQSWTAEDYYISAFNEMSDMLDGRDSLSIKRAAFLAEWAYYHLSPYSYCGGNPVKCVDPTGCVIEGVTKADATMAVEDFRTLFPGDEFTNFRNLIVQSGKKQNGKSFAPISSDALSAAFNGISLTEDQQALVEIVVNTINSNDKHKVEYIHGTGVLSGPATDAFLPLFMGGEIGTYMPLILERNGGFLLN